jgi:hypothetical protein
MVTDDVLLHDQHCHGVVTTDLDADTFGGWLTEAPAVVPGRDPFDSMLGVAVRRWCAPLLDLPTHVDRDRYLERRGELGWRDVTARLLRAARVTSWLVDTGFTPSHSLTTPAELAALGGGSGYEVVRVERVAESLVEHGERAGTLLDAFRSALHERARTAIALKSVIGYRWGLAVPPDRPADGDARVAAERWLRSPDLRIREPVLLSWLVHEAARVGAELGLPLQFHTGLGDPDLHLHQVDPALLTRFIASTARSGITIVLLHCWPYHRNAAYLAHAYPHVVVDIGLTVPFVGARIEHVLGEILELAPFDAVVYSSDGRAVPETHYLAAALWRHHLGRLLDRWIRDGDLGIADAERLAVAMSAGNAERLHPRL